MAGNHAFPIVSAETRFLMSQMGEPNLAWYRQTPTLVKKTGKHGTLAICARTSGPSGITTLKPS